MLVLTRRVNEAVIIETEKGPMKVVVMQIKGKQVRLGFKGDCTIDREESKASPRRRVVDIGNPDPNKRLLAMALVCRDGRSVYVSDGRDNGPCLVCEGTGC